MTQSTMKGYIRIINLVLSSAGYVDVGVYNNHIFTDTTNGLIQLIKNQFSNHQVDGAIGKHHNKLPRYDVVN